MDKDHLIKTVQECTDTSDCVELSRTSGLYLKPVARLNITVTLPQLKSGQSISNWEVMEKLRAAIQPQVFSVIKVTKSTLEFLRFDAEIENKKYLSKVIGKIDQKGIKLSGFTELLKIRATEAKTSFPSRHDWDSFFRDAKHMNEMKPGERPDTVHFQDLPCRWFTHIDEDTRNNLPSSYVLSKVMSSYGEVRVVDIPICDPYRKKMSASINGLKTFSYGQDLIFEAYVQFKEYIGFAKCMHALQGKKMVFVENDKAFSANIKVDFDRTKHLSEYSIKKRQAERDKLQAAEREKEEKMRRKMELEEIKREAEKLKIEEALRLKEERKEVKRKEKEERRKAREEKRRANRMEKEEERIKREQEEEEARFVKKIALEERKLLIAQRKLESIRLLDELFQRIKVDRQKKVAQLREHELFEHVEKDKKKMKELQKKEMKEKKIQEKMAMKERQLRDKLVRSYKSKEEDRVEQQREKVRKAVQGQVRIQSGISIKSLSSISSATSQSSSSDLSSDSDSDSDISSGSLPDIKLNLGHMRMDHMEDDKYGQMKCQNVHPYPPNYDKYGYQDHHNYQDDWGYNDGYDRGRGRGRGRWRYPRGYWRGRGFRDRGRGFRDRGRGFRGGHWQEGNYVYDESKKPEGPPKPKATWYKRGEANDADSRSRSTSRSRSRRSRSRSRSRRSRSRRSRSRSRRSRSRSRRSRSRSRSRSKSKRKTRSRSRSKRSRSHSKSRSERSRSKERSKSKNSRSRSRSAKSRSRSRSRSRKKSKSRSRSRSRKRSRTRSRSKQHSRSRSRSKRRKHSSSEDRSSYSSERRRDKHRNERLKDRGYSRRDNRDKVSYDDLHESELELSSDPENQYSHDYYPDDERNHEYYQKDFYHRGGRWRGRPNFPRGGRGGRWPRQWRGGRGRGGWGYPGYQDFQEQDNWRHHEYKSGDQYRDVYHKYFKELANRETSDKQKDDQDEERDKMSVTRYDNSTDRERYDRSREREGQRRSSNEINFPPEEPLRERSKRSIEERRFGSRSDEMEDEANTKNFENKRISSRDRENNGESRLDYEEKDHGRMKQSYIDDRRDRNRAGGYEQSHQGHRSEDYRVKERDGSQKLRRGQEASRDEDLEGIDQRWKTQVMRADLERLKSDKKETSVKDRLSFVHVKQEPGTKRAGYNPGFDVDFKPPQKRLEDARFRSRMRDGQMESDRYKERSEQPSHSRERIRERSIEEQPRRGEQHRIVRERREVKVFDRDGREEPIDYKSRHVIERQDSPAESLVSAESDSESVEERSRRKRDHTEINRRKEVERYESERASDSDDDSGSHHKSGHKKKRKKKRDERDDGRKHKHKKKKKKKDSRRE